MTSVTKNIPNVLVASEWNALREGTQTDENGKVFYVGSVVITCFFDKKYEEPTGKLICTNVEKKVYIDQVYAEKLFREGEKLVKEQSKDENGKYVTKYYKNMYEHQIVAKKATRVKSGFDGWSVTVDRICICLPRGRCEMRDEEVLVETKTETTTDAKPKYKMSRVRTQPNELLDKIFVFK